jgi:DNA helicase HerA-like ATPase
MSEDTQGRKKVGFVVGGSLKENLQVRLEVPVQDVQEGAFVVIKDGDWFFHGLVTDLQLDASDPRFADEQVGSLLPPGLASRLQGQTLFTNLEVLPALMFTGGENPQGPLPIKTIPSHHAMAYLASEGDIAEIFKGDFVIGYTREYGKQGFPVSINLDNFVKRSAGIFGATGTGKSFLTRLLLAGLIKHDAAAVLVLDMHNEYGFNSKSSDTGESVVGLKTKFPAKVRVVGLGRSAMIHEQPPDFNLEIAMSDIQPEDIELLTRELNLKETTPTTLEALVNTPGFGRQNWFKEFKNMNSEGTVENEQGKRIPAPGTVAAWANEVGTNVMAAEGLHNKLRKVFNKDYIVEKPARDTVSEIIKALESGQHIVLSFGKHENDLDYLLVSNLLTRRIRDKWEQSTNEFHGNVNAAEPRPLVIAVEEAHKLLNREMAVQTTFSTIARELRKYYVTLLIIDQRPSQIYDEVMSQLGTRVSGWLGDEDDIRAVLSGLAGRDALRGMLARLQPKEEVLLLGWGVPMPLPVRSRRYDDSFWTELLGKTGGKKSEKEIKDELGF